MGKGRGFTLVELLVVIAIIALLMSILMPALSKVKNQAKAVACQSNLKQMGTAAQMYCNDNDGYFNMGNASIGGIRSHTTHWASAWERYYMDPDLRCCPTTPKSKSRFDKGGNLTGLRPPFMGWGIRQNSDQWVKGGHYGSYMINGYVLSTPAAEDGSNNRSHFWKRNDVKGAGYAPVLGDGYWIDSWPNPEDDPPDYQGMPFNIAGAMGRICIDRHFGNVNWVFLDNAVKRVGLKQLWLLKWHRTYDINGPWTYAGGVRRQDWANFGTGWMADYKEYQDPP